MAKKKMQNSIPATVAGTDEGKPLVPVVEQPVQPPEEDTPPPLDGTISELLEYADQRYTLISGLWRRTLRQFWYMGRAFVEIQDRLDRANAGKSKRDREWISFERLVSATGVSPNTARKAADVARAFPDPAELEGLTHKEAVEIARSLPSPTETAAEKMERLKKRREKAKERVEEVERYLVAMAVDKPEDEGQDEGDTPEEEGGEGDRESQDSPSSRGDGAEADDEFVASVDRVVEVLDHLVEEAPRVRTRRPDPSRLLKIYADVQALLTYFGVLPPAA